MLILLSPSKKLDESPMKRNLSYSAPNFESYVFSLVEHMKKLNKSDIMKLMSVSEKIADLNVKRYHNFSNKFTSANSKPALFLFKGDVYDKMDVEDYNKEDLDFAQKHLLILSGLYGVLRPLDLMQPYRLEMGTSLPVGDKKNLYEYWQEKVTNYINAISDNVVINLASNEYFAAVDKSKLQAKIINIHFKNLREGKLKVIGLMAKRSRGMMADYIIKNKITNPEKLKKFAENNHVYREDLSDESNYVFVS